MKKINAKKVIASWGSAMSNDPFDKMLPDGDVLPEGMLPMSVRAVNLINSDELIQTSNNEAVPVTHNGKVVGVCLMGEIEFFDTPEGKAAVSYISNIGGPIGISSRKIGTIGSDGHITESDVKENSIDGDK